MRLVGLALVAAWLVAWSAAPHGERERSASIVGAMACAGGDVAAAAWLELKPAFAAAAERGTLHVAVVGPEGGVRERYDLPAGPDAVGFRLAAAGEGRFVLAGEDRTAERHFFDLRRFGGGRSEALPPIAVPADGRQWQLAAAGDEVILTVQLGPAPLGQGLEEQDRLLFEGVDATLVHTLSADGEWSTERIEARVLVGAGGGHVVRYERGEQHDRLLVGPQRAGSWAAEVARPDCAFERGPGAQAGGKVVVATPAGKGWLAHVAPPSAATVTSIVGLRGGYARLSRRGAVGCVDGIRDGRPFAYRDLPLDGILAARLDVDPSGRLSVHEEQEAQVTQRRVLLPPEGQGGRPVVDAATVHPRLLSDAVHYRLFAGDGALGVTALATRIAPDATEVVLERQGAGVAQVLAPAARYRPDHRPFLRWLGALPIACLALGLLGGLRRLGRLRAMRPLAEDRPLVAGPGTLAGTLSSRAEAPAGGLELRRGHGRVLVFLEGAEVLRASDMRPRSAPRGDVVDVAAGAIVVARGVVEPGALYREESRLRARPGDLVLVGCTLEEARRHLTRRLAGSAALLAAVAAVVGAIARAG